MSILSTIVHMICSTMDMIIRLPGTTLQLISKMTKVAVQIIHKLPGTIGRAVVGMVNHRQQLRPQNRDNIQVGVIASLITTYFPFAPRFFPISPFWDMLGVDDADEVVGSKTKRVSTFYCGTLTASDRKVAFLLGLLFTTIFGGLHCIGWSSKFPTPLEQSPWRISSLVTTCLPPSGVGFIVILPLLFDRSTGLTEKYRGWFATVLVPIGVSLGAMYLFACIALLVIAFMSLRSPAPGAFHTIQWTTFIPHI